VHKHKILQWNLKLGAYCCQHYLTNV